jgi:long-chain acyl-CoA synthetase
MNVADHVARMAAARPDHAAILFEGKTLTYGVLDRTSSALASALVKAGVRPGDRVALYLPNIPGFALAYLATLKAGAIAVSINAIFKADEAAYILGDSAARVVFTTAELAANVDRARCPAIEHVVSCEGVSALAEPLENWLDRGDPAFPPRVMARDDPAAILYSSGTTGFPKGVTLSQRNIISNIRTAAKYSEFRPVDKLLAFLPLFHVFAQNYIMNGGFEAGATVMLFRRFVPDVVLSAITREHATMFFGVPTIYIALLAADLSQHDLRSLRYFFSAAATMPQEVSRRWEERFGHPIHEGYGLTECSPFAAYNHLTSHRFGSVGTAVEDFEIRILGDDGREVPRGTWGEICIRGPGVMLGYWGRPEDTARALRDGWLHSGDIGTMDADGYVFIVDRVKDMINVSGFKVWPAEVENALYRHPAVLEIAVYGVPHPEKGEAVRAAVVLKPGMQATGDEIVAYCREKLAVYKAPERVDIVTELPKSATGKILKRVLRGDA